MLAPVFIFTQSQSRFICRQKSGQCPSSSDRDFLLTRLHHLSNGIHEQGETVCKFPSTSLMMSMYCSRQGQSTSTWGGHRRQYTSHRFSGISNSRRYWRHQRSILFQNRHPYCLKGSIHKEISSSESIETYPSQTPLVSPASRPKTLQTLYWLKTQIVERNGSLNTIQRWTYKCSYKRKC